MHKKFGDQPDNLIRHELVRELISLMIGDLVAEIRRRIKAHNLQSADDVRMLGQPVAAFSNTLEPRHREIKAFLFERVYRHHTVNGAMSKARRIMRDLFNLMLTEPDLLPQEWRQQAETDDKTMRARVICDYVAGMTDRFAMEEYRRLFDISDSMA